MAYIITYFVGIIILCHQVSSVIKQILCGVFSLCTVGGGSTGILFSQTLQAGISWGFLPPILVWDSQPLPTETLKMTTFPLLNTRVNKDLLLY
jgi:hypothetical protein